MNFRFKNIVSTVIHLLDISWTRITFNKTSQNQDLLSNKDLLEILNTVKNTDISTKNNLDISHQQLGDKRSLYRGNGMDYEESRKYQLGDDSSLYELAAQCAYWSTLHEGFSRRKTTECFHND